MARTPRIHWSIPITLAAVLAAAALLFVNTMNSNHTHNHGTVDARHMPAIVLSSEKYLWSAIIEEIDHNPDGPIGTACQSIEAKEPALVLCPVSKAKFAVNPDLSLWKSIAEPDAVAIVSPMRMDDGDQFYYQAIRFNGRGLKIAQLPKWAESDP